MFFPRLRNQAKWAFVALIFVFAGGFVFLGVGSGGLDLGSLLRSAFGNGGSSGASISSLEKKVQQRPFNAPTRKQLAQALETKGRTQEAISAWLAYGRLRPKDPEALSHVGNLELSQANVYLQQAQLASQAQADAGVGAAFAPSGKLGGALNNNPISSAASTQASAAYQTAYSQYQSAASQAVASYKQLVKLQPKNQTALFSLAQAAESTQQTKVAINAYTKLLAFDLDPTTKKQIKARIKTLRRTLKPGG
jgi:cytochrome c-type biogenesis protein CcmH/NrfG